MSPGGGRATRALRGVVANGLLTLASRLIGPLFAFAINVGIGRFFGAEVLGVYVHLMALLLVFQAVASAGIPLLLTRELAGRPEAAPELLARARSFALVAGGAATVAFAGYAALVLPASSLLLSLPLAATLLPSALIAVQEAWLMARRAHHGLAVVALAESLVKLALAAVAFALGGGLAALCFGIGLARLAAWGTGELLIRSEGAGGARLSSPAAALYFGRQALPFALVLALSMLYFRLDVLLVEALRGGAGTGLYGAAATLCSAALLLPGSAMSAAYPRLAALFRDSPDGYSRAAQLAGRLLVLGIVPLSLAMSQLAEPLLRLVYGGRFAGAAPALCVLASALPLHAVCGAFGQALQAGRHPIVMLRYVALGIAANGLLGLVLVPRFGLPGAAAAVLASAALVALGSCVAFHRQVAPFPADARTVLTACAGLAPALAAFAGPRWMISAGAAAWLLWAVAAAVEASGHRAELVALGAADPLSSALVDP